MSALVLAADDSRAEIQVDFDLDHSLSLTQVCEGCDVDECHGVNVVTLSADQFRRLVAHAIEEAEL